MNESITILSTKEVQSKALTKELFLIVKRLFDIVLSLFGIIFIVPLAIVVKIYYLIHGDTSSIIYKHKRIGQNGQPIYLIKFRTMVIDANDINKYFTKKQLKEFQKNYKLDNDPRITKIGKILRKTSLDELPQIFNILRGDMSLIGPRPVVDGEIDKYGRNKRLFLSVKPGLTGWWACNGRSATTYEDRIRLELYYCRNISMLLDCKCFFKTIISLIKRQGAK